MTEAQRRYVAINPEDQSLSIERDAVPSPAPGELLIRVQAAGINRADLLQRKGLYPPPPDASPILGLEVAGEVIAVGQGVAAWQAGDPVCALTHGGGYADHAVAPVGQCFPVPENFSMIEAAALPEALLTIWHNLFQRCRLQAGERVLIHGGASGMGTMGIAIARAIGAEVYATRAINYRTEDFEAVIEELGLKDRIDVILDMAAGDFIQKNLNIAAPEGRIVYIAFARGAQAELNFVPLLLKRLTITGSTLRAQSFEQKAVMTREILETVYPHLESGAVRPVIDSVFSLEDAEQAHARMQSGEHMGKIVLRT
jgi:putative PIG3 family NAD(P)H quinone oxidoreductase